MTIPSYARGTTSSTLKHVKSKEDALVGAEAPGSPKVPRTPKKLKRPSMLTSEVRESMAYNANLYPIRPNDHKKPCHLANLPSELRTEIWSYLLDSHPQTPDYLMNLARDPTSLHYFWSRILYICRAIRIEAAYLCYTQSPFHFRVRNLNFDHIKSWLLVLPPPHRELLRVNRNLNITLLSGTKHMFTYPPPGFLVDALTDDHWKACKPYGNLHAIAGSKRQMDFVLFCRLLAWFDLGSKDPYRAFRWSYVNSNAWYYGNTAALGSAARQLCNFLMQDLLVLRRDWSRIWLRGDKKKLATAAKEFLRQFDRAFESAGRDEADDDLDRLWRSEMAITQRAVERW